MITRVFVAATSLALMGVLVRGWAQGVSQKDAERYIIQSERQWAESLATGDAGIVRKILADDFVGIAPDGTLYNKNKEIADTPERPKEFLSNRLNEVKVRFYGDAAVAQGSESWVRRSGSPKRGRYVWTDTWIRRNAQWQVVASVDVEVVEPEK